MEIKINNLQKCFGEKIAVDIEHFTIHKGELIGLVGNNGAGKTTLFRLILDLQKATYGQVCITLPTDATPNATTTDVDPAHSEAWKPYTGAYIDEGFLIDFLTPEEYFEFIGKVNGMTESQVAEQLADFEHFMGGQILGQKKLIRNLSAGNKQKVGIIAALLSRPKLLILDEPFNFLDPTSQNILKHKLSAYNNATGATILVSSHNIAHTIDICPRIVLLENGRLLRDLHNENASARSELEMYFNTNSD